MEREWYEAQKRRNARRTGRSRSQPGLNQGKVRQHAYEMFRDKLPDHPLTLGDWCWRKRTS